MQKLLVAALLYGSFCAGLYLRPVEESSTAAQFVQPPATAAEEPDPPAAPPAESQAEHIKCCAACSCRVCACVNRECQPQESPLPPPEPADPPSPATRTVAAQPVASPSQAGWVYQQPAPRRVYTPAPNPVYWQADYGPLGRFRGYKPAYRPQLRARASSSCYGGT